MSFNAAFMDDLILHSYLSLWCIPNKGYGSICNMLYAKLEGIFSFFVAKASTMDCKILMIVVAHYIMQKIDVSLNHWFLPFLNKKNGRKDLLIFIDMF